MRKRKVMKRTGYRIRTGLLIIIAAFFLAFSSLGTCMAGERLHQDGTIYCVIASNVDITTSELNEYKENGSLRENILLRCEPLIRILGTMETYEGSFEEVNLQELENLQLDSGTAAVSVSMYVKGQNPEEGGITIIVTVIYDGQSKPDGPDMPEEPNTPDVPEEPDIPDIPDVPEEPDTPDIPDVLEESGTPDVPDMPGQPDNVNGPFVFKPKGQNEFQQAGWMRIKNPEPMAAEQPKGEKQQEISEIPVQSDRTPAGVNKVKGQYKEETGIEIHREDIVLAGACACGLLVYGGMLGSDFRLIHWFYKRKKEGMKQ